MTAMNAIDRSFEARNAEWVLTEFDSLGNPVPGILDNEGVSRE